MKKVLVIGCDFSPSSLPNALRLRFLVSHLKEFGWEPTVLTTDTEYSLYPIDEENNKLLPEDLKVIRSKAIPVNRTKYLGLNDIGMRSLWHYWEIISDYCKRGLCDLIIVSVPPHLPMVLARLARKKFGTPYVIDYQDPWISEYFLKLPKDKQKTKSYLAYAMAKVLEPPTIKQASGIIGVSKGTTDDVLQRYPDLLNINTAEIPLGIEPSDFEYLESNPRENQYFSNDGSDINFSYVGVYAPSMEQSVRALFKAFESGLEERYEIFSKIRFRFIGTSYNSVNRLNFQITQIASEYNVSEYVSEEPNRVPYLDAIQLMQDSDVLIALGSEEPHYTASKIFPYILAQKPILAIFHEKSSIVDILNNTGTEKPITFTTKELPNINFVLIKEKLEGLVLTSKNYTPSTNWDVFESYTARAMSKKLATFLDNTVTS